MLVEAKLLHSLNIESYFLVFSVCFGHHSQNNYLSYYQYVVIISIVIMIIRFAKMPIIINFNHTSIDLLQYLDMTKSLSVLCCSIVRQDIKLLLDFIRAV